MQVKMKTLKTIAERLDISKEELLHESIKFFLEKNLRNLKIEIFKITSKYGVVSVEEFEEKYKKGEIEEKDTWQDLQQLDHLEFKKNKIEETLRTL